jgi:tagatose-1,6-bisphosphate aldolase
MLSIGPYRMLSQCSDRDGTFVILAIDHRGNLLADLEKTLKRPATYADVVAFKTSVIRHLGDAASAILLDPDYGLPALTAGAIPGNVGLLAPLEVTDYTIHPSRRALQFIPDWSVARLRQAGFSAAKLLIYFNPAASNVQQQTDIVDSVVEQCRQQGVPLFLEPVTYSPDPERPWSGPERRQAIIETARHFTQRGVDVLKLEFPADMDQEKDWESALAELNAVCTVPWTLLSAGVPFETFLKQAALACVAGASGVIAGRALWSEALLLQGEAREQFLAGTARDRMRQLAAICRASGQPWTSKHQPPVIKEGWYREESRQPGPTNG